MILKYSLFLLLLSFAVAQKTLSLNQTIKIVLQASQSQLYQLSRPQGNINRKDDLIIFAEPVVVIPSQIPTMVIVLSNGTELPCSVDSNELEGLCRSNSQVLASQLSVKVSCKQDCEFWLTAYLNDVISLSLDKQYIMNHKTDTPTIYEFDFQIPKKDFDELTLALRFSKDSPSQQAEMFANVGNAGALQPDQQNHQYEAVPISHGIALDLSKQEVPTGTWVKLSILTSQKVKMVLSAAMRKQQTYLISMGEDRRDLIPPGAVRYFNISMEDYFKQIADYDVAIDIMLYSGYPEISTSFQPNFIASLLNQGVGGNIVYLLTPELREMNNFTGMVYVKLQAFKDEVSFRIFSRTTFKKYIYMSEGSNYLSAVEPQQLKNYIYQYTYQTSANNSQSELLYFAAKIHMIHGAIHFFSRMCNKPDQQCLVTPSNLTDPDYLEEVRDLPGQMLRYYTNYEIYQWTPLSSCLKQDNSDSQSNSTEANSSLSTYKCKLHIVGFNYAKEECRWVMAIYSRQHNIQLREGQSFKDKVYEAEYNYYQFTPPSSPYNSVTIFLTILTGEASMISSLNYQKPEFMFYDKDKSLKTSSRNSITYDLSQIKGKSVSVGVYGDSMAEFMIHVAINRNSSSSALAIPPRLGQLFSLRTTSMQFRLSPDSDATWKVDLSPINGQIKYSVQQLHKEGYICEESTGLCQFDVKGSKEYILNVSRLSDKDTQEIKFMAAYYPKEKCRILPLGTPNFISIPKSTPQCLQFIIDDREVIVAYSRNILASLTRRISLNLSINGEALANSNEHYQAIYKDKIQSICGKNKEDHSKDPQCILKVETVGSEDGPVDMWITAALVEAGIPLYEGVELSIADQDMLTADPLRFYYQFTDQDNVFLEIQSKTYDEYAVELRWVDQEEYLNANSDDGIYPSLGKGNPSYSIDQYHRRLSTGITPDKSCDNCILLVSVYAKMNVTKCELSLQIVGSFVPLGLGQTIKDSLAEEETMTISLSKVDEPTMLTLTNYDRNSCYRAYFVNIEKNTPPSQILVPQISFEAHQAGQIQLVGNSTGLCKFEINRWQSSFPIRHMQSLISYSVQIYNKSNVYFLYYHTPNTTFRIYEVISSGALYTYATPLQNVTLQKALILSNEEYLFGSQSPYEDLEVQVEKKGFCFKCYYLIRLEGAPGAKLEVGVTDMFTPVLLWSDGVIRQKLLPSTTRLYQHFALEPFKLQITIISGVLKVTVKDFNKAVVYSETLRTDTTISVANPNNSFRFYDITITTHVATVYAMQIVSEYGIRIIQGYTFTHKFKTNESYNFLYRHSNTQSIQLIVFLQGQSKSQINFNGTEVVTLSDGTLRTQQVNAESQRSGNMVVFSFQGAVAEYDFAMSSSENVTVKVLVTRNKLTYLPASISMFSFGNFIFEINTHNQRVMVEVFPCKGDVWLQASESYADIEDKNSSAAEEWSRPIILEHNNIAGHYVVNSHATAPEYYAKVSGQAYRISYNYIEDMIPYRWFSQISTTMHYLLDADGITLQFDLPLPLGGSPDFITIIANYEIIYGNNIQDVRSYSQCLLSAPVIDIQQVVPNYPPASNKFSKYIKKEQIYQTLTQKINPLYFGIRLNLVYRYNDVSQQLTYIYEPLHVDVKEIELNDSSAFNWLIDFFIWGVVLVLMAGLVFFAGRFCWRNWTNFKEARGYILAEEESQQSSTNQMKNKPEQASIQT